LALLKQPDPATEQAKQLALAGEAAKVDETKSKTALNIANAQQKGSGAATGVIERQMDAAKSQGEFQLKAAESAVKVQGAQQLAHIKAAGEFAKLRSNEAQVGHDMTLKALQGMQKLQQSEQKHQQDMIHAKAKAAQAANGGKPLPGYQFGGRPTGPSIVGEGGPEIFVPDVPGTIVPNASAFGRDRYKSQLADPRVLDRLIGYTKAEVGGQGPQAQQAFIESILNRGVARGQPLSQVLSGSYFPQETHSKASRPVSEADRATYGSLIDKVLAGSNVSNFATGNASGGVGFAGGPQTFAAGGERFGVEGPDKNWWNKIGAAGPSGAGVGYTGSGIGGLASMPAKQPSSAPPTLGFTPTDAVGEAIIKKLIGG
jgi:hypothetical protein